MRKRCSDVRAAALDLADAQAVLAREYGFEGWLALAEFSEAIGRDGSVGRFEAAVEAVISGDVATLRSMLRDNPELVRERSTRRHYATLLFYVAANGVEQGRQKTPANAVEIAKTLLDAGAEISVLADRPTAGTPPSLSRPSTATQTWWGCSSTLARIRTATTQRDSTRTRRPCIKRRWPATRTWCGCSPSAGRAWIFVIGFMRAHRSAGHSTAARRRSRITSALGEPRPRDSNRRSRASEV